MSTRPHRNFYGRLKGKTLKDSQKRYLDEDLAALSSLLRPSPSELTAARAVSTRVNKVPNHDPSCLDEAEKEVPPPQLGFGF